MPISPMDMDLGDDLILGRDWNSAFSTTTAVVISLLRQHCYSWTSMRSGASPAPGPVSDAGQEGEHKSC